eukprot:scaffold28719_cov29-Prasinocladus_malaysianus.AAC.1
MPQFYKPRLRGRSGGEGEFLQHVDLRIAAVLNPGRAVGHQRRRKVIRYQKRTPARSTSSSASLHAFIN